MMTWNGKELATVGQLFNAVASVETPERAAEFMQAARADSPHADANVGYVIGYADEATRDRLYRLFRLVHPIFGKAV